MCGIHGILHFDGQSPEPALLDAMGNITRHRGPDSAGWQVDGPCGIGVRRLAVMDPTGGHQPFADARHRTWLVCNGEIYNHQVLRQELQAQGCVLRSGSDCELLLHLYRIHGDTFVLQLNGMFAFALWDGARQRLLLGRDRLGIKPLYLLQTARWLAFATEAKALLALPGVHAVLDPAALAGYLHLGYVAAPHCLFAGLRKLPAAHLLAIDARVDARAASGSGAQLQQQCYWRLPQHTCTRLGEREWSERIAAELERAVRLQMVADVPVGAFLSGGVDSSAVVALMARHSSEPVRTYALGFDGGAAERLYNELPHARRVALRFGTRHREILVRPSVAALLPQLLWHLDEPMADSAFITTYLVSRRAREEVTVLLSGVGGDELFGGYRRYLGERYARAWQCLPLPLRAQIAGLLRRLPSDRHGPWGNRLRLARGFVESAELEADARYRSYVQVLSRQATAALLLRPELAGCDPLGLAFDRARGKDQLNRLLQVDLQTQLPDDLLMLSDKMSMAASLECRLPLLDHHLVELAAAIPAGIKLRGGRLKHVFKRALADLLPPEVLQRGKRGFGTPMGAWLKGALAPLAQRLLAPEVLERRGLLRVQAVQQLLADHQASRIDGTDALLALMNLEIWSRMYLDGRSSTDVADELGTPQRWAA